MWLILFACCRKFVPVKDRVQQLEAWPKLRSIAIPVLAPGGQQRASCTSHTGSWEHWHQANGSSRTPCPGRGRKNEACRVQDVVVPPPPKAPMRKAGASHGAFQAAREASLPSPPSPAASAIDMKHRASSSSAASWLGDRPDVKAPQPAKPTAVLKAPATVQKPKAVCGAGYTP